MKVFNKGLVACAVTAALTIPMTAMATNGYFAHGIGMKHKAMGGAGVAAPRDAMSMATNPAASAAVGSRIDFGAEIFSPDRSSKLGTTTFEGNDDDNFLVPEFAYNSAIDAKKSWGIVIYGNGGMNASYTAPVYSTMSPPPGTNVNTSSNLEQLFIAPTFAYKVDDKNTLGVSLNLAYQTIEMKGIGNYCGYTSPGGPAGCADGVTGVSDQGKDSATGWGLKLGWMGKMSDSLSVAFVYATETEMSKFSKYNQLFANGGEFNIPSHMTLGLDFKATPKLNVLFDIQRINYTDIAALSNGNNGNPFDTFLGAADSKGFGWEDMTVFKLGFEYGLNNKTVLRAGWNHGGQPIGADDTAFNVLAPAVVEDHLTLGATWTMADKAELTAYYMHAFENTVTGNSTTPGTPGYGDLTMSQNAIGVGYGWKF